jgi:hypothetical protein
VQVSERRRFGYVETSRLNQDLLEDTFGVIPLHCGSNTNPNVGLFVDALKKSNINDPDSDAPKHNMRG